MRLSKAWSVVALLLVVFVVSVHAADQPKPSIEKRVEALEAKVKELGSKTPVISSKCRMESSPRVAVPPGSKKPERIIRCGANEVIGEILYLPGDHVWLKCCPLGWK